MGGYWSPDCPLGVSSWAYLRENYRKRRAAGNANQQPDARIRGKAKGQAATEQPTQHAAYPCKECRGPASLSGRVDVVGGVVGGVGVAVAVGGVGEGGAGVLGGEGAGGRVIPAVAVVGVAGGVAAADVGQGAGVAEQVGGGQAAVVGQDGAVGAVGVGRVG